MTNRTGMRGNESSIVLYLFDDCVVVDAPDILKSSLILKMTMMNEGTHTNIQYGDIQLTSFLFDVASMKVCLIEC